MKIVVLRSKYPENWWVGSFFSRVGTFLKKDNEIVTDNRKVNLAFINDLLYWSVHTDQDITHGVFACKHCVEEQNIQFLYNKHLNFTAYMYASPF